ncbi:nuclear transport factor 2 family protein [Novosphingobium sp.]|uniref:nuclear transport factor 2 family protein n=1 Tax=Novosphingobium sp. TaxID=1874826 RepID=UPI0026094D46|nr:nuclear transport factor 2 family protein [Novosphingobium sp.]
MNGGFTGPLEDRILIREVMETYAHGVMTKDAELWASTWAEDAFWALPEFPDLGGFTGKAAIVAGWTESMKVYGLANCTKPMVYVVTPGSIRVDGDHAKAISYTSEIFDDPATGQTLRVRGRYEDELARIDGHWLFTRREYRTMHIA